MEQVIEFLADRFETESLQYSTLNLYRSVLSAYHPPIDGFKVGQHPLVRDLLRGAFNTRPPQPRYTETWDVDKVINTFLKWEDNDQLNLSDITHKLTMPMALVSASRCSELSLLEVSLMQDHGDKVIFHMGKLTKSRNQNRPNQSVTFKEYVGNPKLDVVSCLRAYLNKTSESRATQLQQSRLFLAVKKPHQPVKPCTIARWLKVVMEKAGLDVNIFKAHSVRGASTSKANKLGLSTQQIMDRANWAKARTFYTFYYREIQNDAFQDKVLQEHRYPI